MSRRASKQQPKPTLNSHLISLREIHIRDFRNLLSSTSLTFNPRTNVLLGPNGTGKTTLLELVSAMFRGDFSRFAGERLSVDYKFWGYANSFRVEIRNIPLTRPPPQSVVAEEVLVPPTQDLDATSTIVVDDPAGDGLVSIEATSTSTSASFEDGTRATAPGVNVMGPNFISAIAFGFYRHSNTGFRVLQALAPLLTVFYGRFDEALSFFWYLAQHWTIECQELQDKAWVAHSNASAPPEIIQSIQSQLHRNADTDILKFSSEPDGITPVLMQARDLLGFARVNMRLERIEKPSEGRIRFGNASFEFIRSDGTLVNHRQLSFGQQRLLAFLFYNAANSFIVADELVNGLHYSWINKCLELIEKKQVFLTSQNPLLLDHLSFESADQVQNSFIRCTPSNLAGRNTVQWSNFSPREAQQFYDAYSTGIQPVGEILKTRGLW